MKVKDMNIWISERYEYVITAKLQSDPLERRFGHYRQMSEGRFFVNLKDINCSEAIATIRSILKEDINLSQSNVLKTSEIDEEEAEKCPLLNFWLMAIILL